MNMERPENYQNQKYEDKNHPQEQKEKYQKGQSSLSQEAGQHEHKRLADCSAQAVW